MKPQKLTLTREEFMSVCAPLIERFDEPVYDALTSAGLSADDIDAVILAGGSSAMPFVKEKMSGIFPATKILLSPSTEIIAQGLAVFSRSDALAAKASEVYLEDEDDDDDYDDDDVSFVKRHKGLVRFVAVLVMCGALAYSYTRFTTYQEKQEQARIEQERQEQLRVQAEQERIRAEREAEQERLRVEREKAEAERKHLEAERLRAEQERQRAERERQAAERVRAEAERRARRTPARKRNLTKVEIVRVTKKYGFVEESQLYSIDPKVYGMPSYENMYTRRIFRGFTWYMVAFGSNGVYPCKGYYTNNRKFASLSYDDLRNNSYMTYSYLKNKFKDFPKTLIDALMELKELQ